MSLDNDVQQVPLNQKRLSLSDAAIKHVKTYLAKNEKAIGLRLSVSKTGCSGLAYVVDFVEVAQEADIQLLIDDTLTVYIDKKSYPYLKGSTIDYVKVGLNQKFVFTNPNQTGECGCGESFTIE